MDLKKISDTLGRGMLRERFGMDWEQKSELLKAQVEQAKFNLQEAQRNAAEIESLVRAGKLPSSNMDAAKYLLDKARQDVAMTLDQAQKAEAEARTGLIQKQTGAVASPEEAQAERKARREQIGASTKASGASAGYYSALTGTVADQRAAQAERDRAAAAYNAARQKQLENPTMAPLGSADAAYYRGLAEKNLAGSLAGGGVGNFFRRATGGQNKTGLTKGTPEYEKAVEDEINRLRTSQVVPKRPGAPAEPQPAQEAQPAGAPRLRRDPASGKTFIEIGGQLYPVSQDLAPQGAPSAAPAPQMDEEF